MIRQLYSRTKRLNIFIIFLKFNVIYLFLYRLIEAVAIKMQFELDFKKYVNLRHILFYFRNYSTLPYIMSTIITFNFLLICLILKEQDSMSILNWHLNNLSFLFQIFNCQITNWQITCKRLYNYRGTNFKRSNITNSNILQRMAQKFWNLFNSDLRVSILLRNSCYNIFDSIFQFNSKNYFK